MNITSKELKRRARATLEGKYFPATNLATFLFLFNFLMSFLLQHTGFAVSTEPMHKVLYWLLWAIMTLLCALMEVGLLKFLYDLSREGGVSQLGVIFYAFRNQPDTFILTSGFRYVVTLIWFVPALVMLLKFPFDTPIPEWIPALLPILGLMIAALLPAVILALPFCMSNYVLLDNPYCSARAALLTSAELMRGRKVQVLKLWLSFLPLLLVSLGTYGIGLFWLRPYYHTTINQFYLEITGQRPIPDVPEEPLV